MSDDLRVTVDASDVHRALRKAAQAAELEGAKAPIESAAVRALAAASPRRTGALARSARPIRAQGVVAAARPTARYAGPVNSGVPARGIRATNFVDRAAQRTEATASVTAERYLARELGGL